MKSSIISKLLFFAAGAAIGSAVTWKIVKTKYEKIAQEEIESVREMYENEYSWHAEDEDCEEVEEEENEEEEDERLKKKYGKLVKDAGYTLEEGDDDVIEPYVIIPEEFDEVGYTTISLVYYADGVLAYSDTNERVEDIGELVCEDFAAHFGEYEEDSVFVRNDNLRMDIEILRDLRTYQESEVD